MWLPTRKQLASTLIVAVYLCIEADELFTRFVRDEEMGRFGFGRLLAFSGLMDLTEPRRSSGGNDHPFLDGPEGVRRSLDRFRASAQGACLWLRRPGVEEYKGQFYDFSRRDMVRNMMRHAWAGYYDTTDRHTTPSQVPDELKPVSGRADSNWYGIGLTAFDSLTTLFAMDLHDEYEEALELVLEVCQNTFHPNAWTTGTSIGVHDELQINIFETNIRHLGAMISMYGQTKDIRLLRCSAHLGDLLMTSFDKLSGFAHHQVTLTKGQHGAQARPEQEPWMQNSMVLSEMGSLQLEFRYLSEYTHDRKYAVAANRFTKRLQQLREDGWPLKGNHYAKDAIRSPHKGLFNIYHHKVNRKLSGKISMGGFGDSFYEYLLKQWIAFGKKDEHLARMYEDAVEGMYLHLVKYVGVPYAMVGSIIKQQAGNEDKMVIMDHLSCFVGGMLAQGVAAGIHRRPGRVKRFWGDVEVDRLSKDITYACKSLFQSPSGLSPEEVIVKFESGTNVSTPMTDNPSYKLRPETVESAFHLYRTTGAEIYVHDMYLFATAIETHCKTKHGYAALHSVFQTEKGEANMHDRMESYFLAETLKYLWMTLDATVDRYPASDYVFNTEGHPLPIFKQGVDQEFDVQPEEDNWW